MRKIVYLLSVSVFFGIICLLPLLTLIQPPNGIAWGIGSSQVVELQSRDDENRRVLQFASKRYYVVLASDANPTYLFPLPITVLSYNRLGVVPVVFLIGSERLFTSQPQTNTVVNFLLNCGARLIFIESNMTSTHMLAQTIRLFATGVKGFPAPDNADVIIGDADMLIFSLVDRLPQPGQRVFVYFSKCCGYIQSADEPGGKYPHYPMQNMIMSTTTWREVMNITKDSIKSGDDVARYLIAHFGQKFVQTDQGLHGAPNWSIDQLLISSMIHKWLNASADHRTQFGEFDGKPRRIDRPRWKTYKFGKFSLNDFHDSHIPHPVHTEPNWGMTLPLLKMLFDEKVVDLLNEYHEQFLRNSTLQK